MNVLTSLRGRIFLSGALLAVLSIGAAVFLVSVRVTREAERAMQRELVVSGAVVEQLRTTRAQTFTTMTRLMADAPKLKAAVDTNDPLTVQDVVNGYRSQIDPNLMLVTGRNGAVLAAVGLAPAVAREAALLPAVEAALAGREGSSLLPQPDGVLQLVTVPIAIGLTRPDVLGSVSVGFLFDAALARQLKAITGSEIAFGLDGRVLSTTLPAEADPALRVLIQQARGTGRGALLRAGDYAALPLPLSGSASVSGADGPVALVLRSRAEQLAFLRTIYRELTVTAGVAVLLATLLGYAVARTVTRPIAAVTDVMREVAATGDLTRKIVLPASRRWDDEDARLLAATFNALTESIARFQREISQRERLASLGRLSTVIAHEVRNPLMVIKASLHTLRRDDVSDATLREVVADIDDEVVRLNRIVNEVLDFARPIRLELSTADLNALCRESAAAAQVGPGAPVDLRLDPAMPPVVTDAGRLRVALVNVIENARHAVGLRQPAGDDAAAAPGAPTSPAAATLSVRLSTERAGDRVVITVADPGVGIGEAELSRVFDPFFTTRRGGTGLGLPIAKNIIDGLGGSIGIATAVGQGTTMRIELPIESSDSSGQV